LHIVSQARCWLEASCTCSKRFVWQGYLPRDYEVLTSAYGSEAELRACIAALHQHGVMAVADVVLNHRCAGRQARGAQGSRICNVCLNDAYVHPQRR
jgi:pullulanase/glycogen debranching enzyme